MDTRTQSARRSYSNDDWTAGLTHVRTTRNVVLPAVHVCKANPDVAKPASGLILQASQNDLLHSASRVGLPHAEAETQRLILAMNRATVHYKYNKPRLPSQDIRLEPSNRLAKKQTIAEPCLKFICWLGFKHGFDAADPAWLGWCPPLLAMSRATNILTAPWNIK